MPVLFMVLLVVVIGVIAAYAPIPQGFKNLLYFLAGALVLVWAITALLHTPLGRM